MTARWKKKVKASSLVEVTTAMIIISMVFGIAISIYLQAQRSVLNWQKLSASICADNMVTQITKDSMVSSLERTVELENFDVRIQVYRSGQATDLWLVKVNAYNKEGLLLAEKKQLIFKGQ